jgi:ABC-type bacteriocin/lantibiotic exporter with double-glycine peptidase domain
LKHLSLRRYPFEKVRFGYIPDEEVIKGIDFRNAQTIVGSTGAGKSTIKLTKPFFMKLTVGLFILTIKILRIIH